MESSLHGGQWKEDSDGSAADIDDPGVDRVNKMPEATRCDEGDPDATEATQRQRREQ